MSKKQAAQEFSTVRIAAAKLGVTPRTLKYYEERGLVKPTRSNGRYRLYDDNDLQRFARILRLRSAGFSLDAITEIVTRLSDITDQTETRYLSEQSLLDIKSALLDRITMLDERLVSLQREKKELETIRTDVKNDLDYILARLSGGQADALLADRARNTKSRQA